MTEEHRVQMIKSTKAFGENTARLLRNIRTQAREELKSLKKSGFSEDDVKRGEKEVKITISL